MSEALRRLRTEPLRRFKPYPAYKNSGVEWLGEIPTHWEVKRLKHLARVASGFGPPESYDRSTGDHPVYGSNGLIGYCDQYMTTQEMIAVGRVGASGLVNVVPAKSWVSDNALLLWELSRTTQLGWLRYVLDCMDLGTLAAKNAQPIITGTFLSNQALAVPPEPEQRAIAAFLDRETARIDALVAKKERLIELLQEKRTALITRAVTKGLDPTVPMKDSGVEWLGEIPAHWEAKRLRNVVDWIEQGWSPDCENREADDDEWGVLKAGCVNRGRFIEEEHKALPAHLKPLEDLEVHAGDLLMSRASGSRDLVGSAAVVPRCRPRLLLCDKVFRLHLATDTHRPFLAYALNSRIARWQIELSLSGGSGLANNIAQGVVKDLVVVAPSFDEQRTIAGFLDRETSKLDALIARVRDAIDRLKELRAALISAAVTGKIDVRIETSPEESTR